MNEQDLDDLFGVLGGIREQLIALNMTASEHLALAKANRERYEEHRIKFRSLLEEDPNE